MDERLMVAADSNAAWCDVVCRLHGIPTERSDEHWVALRRPPEGYPDAVTLRPGATAADVLHHAQDGPGCAVKDSFADLDLGASGFDVLLEARWIHRVPALPTVTAAAVWTVVETDAELADWATVAGVGGALRAELLGDPSVRILAVRGPVGVRAGAIAHLAASVVGISNVFAATVPVDDAWKSLATEVAGHFPGCPLVGYERAEDLRPALWAGFTDIGALRVWRRPEAKS